MATTTSPLIFYKHITPYWLKDKAGLGFAKETAEVTETSFKVPSDVRKYESLFQLELLASGVLSDDDDIVVKLKVGCEYPGSQRRDPMIFTLWCPGEDESMSIQINDPADYRNKGPFHGVAAEASRRGLSSVDTEAMKGRPTQSAGYRFSEMYEFTYCPNSYGERYTFPWSSAYCAVDTGIYSAFGPYYKNLKLSKGLNLGIYRDQLDEEYILKSLEIFIYRNSRDALGN